MSHIRLILLSFFILLGVTGLIFLLMPKEKDITVQKLSWERSIDIEKYKTLNESDWTLPSGARLKYSQDEFSHYEQVLDHYETKTRQVEKQRISGYEEYVTGYKDLGNGFFEEETSTRPIYETYYEEETYEEPVYRDEPVYRTKYYYEIDKWVYERSVETKGDASKEPFWPDVVLKSKEREASKEETYLVIGVDEKEKKQSIKVSYEDWKSLEIDETVRLRISAGYGEIVE